MEENNFFNSHLTEVDPSMLTPNDTVIHKLLKEQKLEDGKCNKPKILETTYLINSS